MHMPGTARTRPTPPRAVLLDALGTLLALEPPAPRLRSELAGRFGVDVSTDEASSAIAAEIAYYRAHLDQGRDRTSLGALRRHCAEVVRAALPALADVDGDALTEALLESLRFRVFDDVVPALRSLRERSITLVVVSNWDVSLHDVLARLEVRPLVDGILTSAEAGVRKPEPAIFRRALELAGVEAGAAVHVGDSPEDDVAGARAAGIAPVLIRRGTSAPAADTAPTISELGELDSVWA